MKLEMVVDVASASLGSESWQSPGGCVWICARYVGWLSAWCKTPHLDEVASPFHGNDSTTNIVKCLAVV